jgi:hypothetical protein
MSVVEKALVQMACRQLFKLYAPNSIETLTLSKAKVKNSSNMPMQ